MKHLLRARDFMQHMADAAQRIQSYIGEQERSAFMASPLLQDAVIRNIEILGEAAKNLLRIVPDAEVRFPLIPFSTMYVTRNRIIHGYFSVQPEIIWGVASEEIPKVYAALTATLRSWPGDLT